MGVNRDTKIFYLHDISEEAFTGIRSIGSDDRTNFQYKNKNGTDRIDRINIMSVWTRVSEHHGKNPNTKDPYPETIFPLVTFPSIDHAKDEIFHPELLEQFNIYCDKQEWTLTDNNKGLKQTRDWKIENDPTKDSKYTQFKKTNDYRWSTIPGTYLNIGGILTDSDEHLF